jgi:hypothetical protein
MPNFKRFTRIGLWMAIISGTLSLLSVALAAFVDLQSKCSGRLFDQNQTPFLAPIFLSAFFIFSFRIYSTDSAVSKVENDMRRYGNGTRAYIAFVIPLFFFCAATLIAPTISFFVLFYVAKDCEIITSFLGHVLK